MKRFVLVALGIFVALSAWPNCVLAQGTPSGASILEQSVKAYDALTSYSCHVSSTATGVGSTAYKADADIQFARPGQIAESGTTMFGSPYSLVSNGSTTTVVANGTSQTPKSIDLGIATVTGISQGAGATIPSLLLHTQFSYPFGPGRTVSNSIITQSVNGHPCYMVIILTPIRQAFWIDTQTFLIDQVATKIQFGSFTFRQLQTVTNSVTNPTIPPSTFSVPA